MIRTVLLDLDDTILDFHRTEAVAVSETLRTMGVEPTEQVVKRYSEINDGLWKQLEKGEVTREEVLVRRFEILYEEIGIDRSGPKTKELYEKVLSTSHFFVDGAEELLEKLYGRFDLYIISNGTAVVQDGRIKSADIAKYFKDIFISQRIGINKPDKRFFEKCFEKIENFSKDESVIIGDSLTSDIKGGNNVGIKTVWFNPHGKKRTTDVNIDYEVSSLYEIPGLLENI